MKPILAITKLFQLFNTFVVVKNFEAVIMMMSHKLPGDDVSMFEDCSNVFLVKLGVKPRLSALFFKNSWRHVTNDEDLRKNSGYYELVVEI